MVATVAKRVIKPAMVDYAKTIGAMRSGKPDWYLVVENFAQRLYPELLDDDDGRAKRRGPGRPALTDDDFLAAEVHRVRDAFNVSVLKACRSIERGDAVPLLRPRVERDGTRRKTGLSYTVGSPWQGIKHTTLEQRYCRWLKREKARQKNFESLTTEIP